MLNVPGSFSDVYHGLRNKTETEFISNKQYMVHLGKDLVMCQRET